GAGGGRAARRAARRGRGRPRPPELRAGLDRRAGRPPREERGPHVLPREPLLPARGSDALNTRKRMLTLLPVVLVLLAPAPGALAPLTERYADLGTMIVTTSSHSMFPHEKRANGHTYDGKAYPADVHYSDRTVAIFVPKGFRAGDATDLVFWFHGWRNNVDDA